MAVVTPVFIYRQGMKILQEIVLSRCICIVKNTQEWSNTLTWLYINNFVSFTNIIIYLKVLIVSKNFVIEM